MLKRIGLFALLLFMAQVSFAVEPDEILDDPELEARARALSAELRCVVCQGESIDASQAGVARDIRLIVREEIVAGKSDEEIKNLLVERYGEFVLFKPRLSGSGLIAWLAGPVLLIFGLALVFFSYRNQRNAQPDDDFVEDEI